MKVGIDLSSTNTGLVILSDDNKLIWHGNFKLWDSNRFVIASNVNNMINTIMCKRLPNEVVNVGVELADFKNANITNRFNLLTGMIISELGHWMEKGVHTWNTPLVKLKLFNSNEWQRFLLDIYKPDIKCIKEIVGYEKYDDGDSYVDVVPIYKEYYQINYRYKTAHELNSKVIFGGREYKSMRIEKNERLLRKALSRLYTKQHCFEYTENWTEDECDAYCIAYFLEKLRDRTEMHQEVKAKKVQAKKSKLAEKREEIKKWRRDTKLRQIQCKYLNILASGKKLTKAQDRALDNAIRELKGMENEKTK